MPRYTYSCTKCNSKFEYFHSISEKKTQCEACKEETLLKIPLFSGTIKSESSKKVGSIVEEYIQQTKEEIRHEKEQVRKLEYKPE